MINENTFNSYKEKFLEHGCYLVNCCPECMPSFKADEIDNVKMFRLTEKDGKILTDLFSANQMDYVYTNIGSILKTVKAYQKLSKKHG